MVAKGDDLLLKQKGIDVTNLFFIFIKVNVNGQNKA
jgi:hypothetical protein